MENNLVLKCVLFSSRGLKTNWANKTQQSAHPQTSKCWLTSTNGGIYKTYTL